MRNGVAARAGSKLCARPARVPAAAPPVPSCGCQLWRMFAAGMQVTPVVAMGTSGQAMQAPLMGTLAIITPAPASRLVAPQGVRGPPFGQPVHSCTQESSLHLVCDPLCVKCGPSAGLPGLCKALGGPGACVRVRCGARPRRPPAGGPAGACEALGRPPTSRNAVHNHVRSV